MSESTKKTPMRRVETESGWGVGMRRRPTINEAIGMFQLSRQQPRVHVTDDIADVLIEAATLVATFDPDVVLRDAVAAEVKKCKSYRCTCSADQMVSAAVVAWFEEVERIEGE